MSFSQWLIKSSTDPAKVSATVQGVLLTWVSLIIFLGQSFGVDISEGWLTTTIQTLSAFAGSVLITFGLVRKLYFLFKK